MNTLLKINANGNAEPWATFPDEIGARAIWRTMAQRHGIAGEGETFLAPTEESRAAMMAVWALVGKPHVPFVEQVVIASTFPRTLVDWEDVSELATCFEKFDADYPDMPTSLAAQAKLLDDFGRIDPGYKGVCWEHGGGSVWTVSGRPWNLYGDKREGDRTVWLFDVVAPNAPRP